MPCAAQLARESSGDSQTTEGAESMGAGAAGMRQARHAVSVASHTTRPPAMPDLIVVSLASPLPVRLGSGGPPPLPGHLAAPGPGRRPPPPPPRRRGA